MTGAELASWSYYEQVHGPILVHDRIDIGLATVAYTVASVAPLKKRPAFSNFLPPWLRELTADERIKRGFEKLTSLVGQRFEDE